MRAFRVEWPTLLLIAACYGAFGLSTTLLPPLLSIIATAIVLTLFSSIQHEVLHGHPFHNKRWNEALVAPSLFLTVPYQRFRDTHLAHHRDANLTDPYDDPETNYLDPAVWSKLPRVLQGLLRLNNTLLGRIVIGPAIGQYAFMRSDWQAYCAGDPAVARAWVVHAVGAIPVFIWVAIAPITLIQLLIATYIASGILRIRTFLEHQAHEKSRARTVIVESRGPLSILFLNNNFHAVHHMHPQVAWFDLPKLYKDNKARYLKVNEGYVYTCYLHVARDHLLRAKDAVAHPLWRRD
jgi:fatty acid desaturase